MMQGETISSGASGICCGKELKLEVLRSAAGYYIGTFCQQCGPYSRESGYYSTTAAAEYDLKHNLFFRV